MSEHNLAKELEDSPLREELFGPKTVTAEQAPAALAHTYKMQFTGDGSEYFRIWIVNLLLTLVTLGIYSAWAKVRKTRYFSQNTRLDGAVFDYHGPPVAILRGRIIALLLLIAYTWGADISVTAGYIVVGVLLVVGPWLFMKSQQFRFRNTNYRGLRFGFSGAAGTAYRRLLPLLAIWFAPTLLALAYGFETWALFIGSFGTLLLWPWMHHALKSYQHTHASYGDKQFSFEPARVEFYGVYAKGLAFLIPASIGGGALTAALFAASSADRGGEPSDVHLTIGLILFALVVYTAVWPYLAARLQQIVWDHTHLPGARFTTNIQALPLFKLVAKNVALTLLTCGLYWPYAAIALARYRIECFAVFTEVPLSEVARNVEAAPVSAAGEGAADLFGLDIGL